MSKMLQYTQKVERWGIFEAALEGKSDGNPFTDYEIKAEFTGANEHKTVDGFYDGEGVYKVRFMPSFEGTYTFRVYGTYADEDGYEGTFEAGAAFEGNHGPVRVCNTFHFAYEDGTPYYSIGTTCYVWALQPEELQEQTLKTLKESAFNKIRFCVFPKHYDYNFNEPYSYPYEGTPVDSSVLTRDNFMQYNGRPEGNNWDYKRFNPGHFAHLEKRIGDLMALGIEADIIVMHPYDRWGFSLMSKEEDDLYWKYLIARFSAYRNVWWSHGGVLKGTSPERFKFLLKIMKETPGHGLKQAVLPFPSIEDVAATVDSLIPVPYYIFYYGFRCPSFKEFYFDDEKEYEAEILDTWDMTVTKCGTFKGKFKIQLPAKQYMAVRIYEKGLLSAKE